MVKLTLKNIAEIEEEFHSEIKKYCEEKLAYYNDLFKKYNKDLTLEVTFNKSSSLYKTAATINLKSKNVLIVKEDKDVMKALTATFSDFKAAVKRQYELERKDYEYKRKR
jgi:ribosome-associated translation inhibitor RaiA